jgi:aspartate kinase
VATHITVSKFGGTSIADSSAFARVARIVKAKQPAALVVIVSAMSGVTDALIESFRDAPIHGARESMTQLDEHFTRHLDVGRGLARCRFTRLENLIETSRTEICELLDRAAQNQTLSPRIHDAIVSHGERLAANLLTLVLEEHELPADYVDARRCVITNDQHGEAEPLFADLRRRSIAELLPLVKQKRIPVLGGFIGATLEGVTTTMGRGSSDYSATLIGAALRAHEIEIWTDVDGVQTADPRLVKSTRTVPHISYAEAAQLANLGARVMHPKMIEPVIGDRIPIRILNSHAPQHLGTLISAESSHSNGDVKAIAHKIAGDSAIVGCVGLGLKRNLLAALGLSLNWHSSSTNNLLTFVEPEAVDAVVRQLHAALFES